MTFSDLQHHSRIASLCKYDVSYSFAAVDKISIDYIRCSSRGRNATIDPFAFSVLKGCFFLLTILVM